jgi:hypothetical protein
MLFVLAMLKNGAKIDILQIQLYFNCNSVRSKPGLFPDFY